jgi:uncharacterized protein YecE (DUF72 family)
LFKTVCVDATYYRFPTQVTLARLVAQVPPEFRFALKVTDRITIRRFPRLARFGPHAGQTNPDFLNADMFVSEFLGPCQVCQEKLGILIFEFSQFGQADFPQARDFTALLEPFLVKLPSAWPYGIEVRNAGFLQSDYLDTLARHGVTHVFNSWERMPAVLEQLTMAGVFTTPSRVAARFLLQLGRAYEEAVRAFSPYAQIVDPDPAARAAVAALISDSFQQSGRRKTFIYVNNRLEGNAPDTIHAMLEQAGVLSLY